MSHSPPVGLSASSTYPRLTAFTFEMAQRLGYDGVEVMVWNESNSRETSAIAALVQKHQLPVLAVHAPTLFLLPNVWGTTWRQIDRSVALAESLGAPTVVAHPPFAWQRRYGGQFVAGIAERQQHTDVRIAVENMYPWRMPGASRRLQVPMYLPGWDPTHHDYANLTLDLSHTATAGADAVAMARAAAGGLAHIHLADGNGGLTDEHLVPGDGTQPCAEVLRMLPELDFTGSVVVEVSTRGASDDEAQDRLARSLAFAREHLAATYSTGDVG